MASESIHQLHSRSTSAEEGHSSQSLLPQDHSELSTYSANEPSKTDGKVEQDETDTRSSETKKRWNLRDKVKLRLALQKRWIIEILAGLLALVALAAIAITLGTHNGRPLPDWPLSISVNALVSIFAVILKIAMMVPVAEAVSQLKWLWYQQPRPLSDLAKFDLASRGAWGAAQLIPVLRGFHLASLGALITILALAVDPFIQQVIRYHPCPQTMSGTQASILRTNLYTVEGIHSGADESTLDLPMQAAIYEGVYDSFSAVEPTCSTGNCTFPHYRTVGMCNGCMDISSAINVSCGTALPGESFDSCNFTLPSGLNLTVPSEGLAMRMTSISDADVVSLSEILGFTSVLGYDETEMVNGEDVMALECALFPCVRTYSSNVSQGTNTEVLLSAYEMGPETASPVAPYIGIPMPCLIDGVYHNASSFTNKSATNNNTINGLLPNNATAYLPDECIFTYQNLLGLRGYLPTFLSGYVDYAPEVTYADPDWMGQLYNSANVSLTSVNATWTALAESMTIQIRKNGDSSNSKPAIGTVYRTDTCISVRWPWLSFPAALLVLMWVFLLATVVKSSKHTKHQVWKASPLALLFHGMDQELRERHRLVDEVDEMETTAKGMKVQIKHEEGGLRFVPVEEV